MPRRILQYATLALVRRQSRAKVIFADHSALISRAVPTTKMLLELERLAAVSTERDQTSFVQFDDCALHDAPSVAFGRAIGSASCVGLIPDTYFYESEGYSETRVAAETGELPKWAEREDTVFWRGSPTTNWFGSDGGKVTSVRDIPRVAMCDALKNDDRCDVGIFCGWGDRLSHEDMVAYFRSGGIFRPPIPMIQHARYKFLIDVDGVANAWSLLDKLLLGSCVVKIRSPYEQWYYSRMKEWVHFVPVERDLSNLHEILDWCFTHDAEARAIGAQGQQFALSESFPKACEHARLALQECALPL